ncbi:MAG: hypothetical protein ACYSU0_18960 [Planctomycetota bacterium]|jgi:hypothetical protein
MSPDAKIELSETLTNVVENLACRVAERLQGRITPNHLVPYVPMSLALIKRALESMVDGSSVLSEERDGAAEFVFTAYQDKPEHDGAKERLSFELCVSCGRELVEGRDDSLCTSCGGGMASELTELAETTGWPAQAVYEHELLYLAAGHDGPVRAEDLAGRSQYTLRNTRRKLDRLSLDGFVRQELDSEAGAVTYRFPKIDYPKDRYRRNMAVVRSHPASVTEEVELKVVRIAIVLGLMVLAAFVAMFAFHLYFPAVVGVLLVAAPVTSVLIWKHRSRPEED